MPTNIIFLDVDGPLINLPLYHIDKMASHNRSVVSTTAIGYLAALCRDHDCKIVMNTMHNSIYTPTGNVKEDLIAHGLDPRFFHVSWKTQFPGHGSRLEAIEQWLSQNAGIREWVCFDDENIGHRNQVMIDFNKGIDDDSFNEALKILELVQRSIIV